MRKSLQVWPCKAKLCVYPVALALIALVLAGRTRGQLDLLARRQHDERRGAVSVLPKTYKTAERASTCTINMYTVNRPNREGLNLL